MLAGVVERFALGAVGRGVALPLCLGEARHPGQRLVNFERSELLQGFHAPPLGPGENARLGVELVELVGASDRGFDRGELVLRLGDGGVVLLLGRVVLLLHVERAAFAARVGDRARLLGHLDGPEALLSLRLCRIDRAAGRGRLVLQVHLARMLAEARFVELARLHELLLLQVRLPVGQVRLGILREFGPIECAELLLHDAGLCHSERRFGLGERVVVLALQGGQHVVGPRAPLVDFFFLRGDIPIDRLLDNLLAEVSPRLALDGGVGPEGLGCDGEDSCDGALPTLEHPARVDFLLVRGLDEILGLLEILPRSVLDLREARLGLLLLHDEVGESRPRRRLLRVSPCHQETCLGLLGDLDIFVQVAKLRGLLGVERQASIGVRLLRRARVEATGPGGHVHRLVDVGLLGSGLLRGWIRRRSAAYRWLGGPWRRRCGRGALRRLEVHRRELLVDRGRRGPASVEPLICGLKATVRGLPLVLARLSCGGKLGVDVEGLGLGLLAAEGAGQAGIEGIGPLPAVGGEVAGAGRGVRMRILLESH